MPKSIDRDLLDCLRRPNPNVEYRVEISAPDVGRILRRPDQFGGPELVSMTPANSLVAGTRGLTLSASSSNLANFAGVGSSYDLNREDPQRRLKGMRWTVDPAFDRGVLRSFTARIKRSGSWWTSGVGLDFTLDVHRVTRIPGKRSGGGDWVEYVFPKLLSVTLTAASIVWDGNDATLTFPLQNYGVVIDNGPPDSVSPDQTSELPAYYFVVRPEKPPATTGLFSWYVDTATTRAIAGVGTFERVFWNRDSENEQWAQQVFADVPSCTIAINNYVPTGQAVYAIDLGRVPAAGTTGRVVFERHHPRNTVATLEISYAGPAGPWTPILNEDIITTAQQVYWLRVTLQSA